MQVVYVVQDLVQEAHTSVAVEPPIGIGRGIVQLDRPCHTLKAHSLDERVEQLAAINRRAVLHLNQVVQCMRDRKYGIVTKGVVRAIAFVWASTNKCCAGVIVVILCPQIPAVVIDLLVAHLTLHGGCQLSPSGEVALVSGPIRLAILHQRKETFEHALTQRDVR